MHSCACGNVSQIQLYKQDDDDGIVLDCSQHTSTYSYHFRFPELTMRCLTFRPLYNVATAAWNISPLSLLGLFILQYQLRDLVLREIVSDLFYSQPGYEEPL